MKTREIDVWLLNNYDFRNNAEFTYVYWNAVSKPEPSQPGDKIFKAKLIIELPEKKIEVTASQLMRALAATVSSEDFIKELFGDKE